MQNHVLGSFYSSFLGIEIDFLYSLASSLFRPQPRFHTKSNNVPPQFPPPRHLMCVPRQSCECAALSGWASSRFLAIYNVNRQPRVGVSPRSRRWGGESRLNVTWVSVTLFALFGAFSLVPSCVSHPHLLASSLSLSSLQTFSIYLLK